MLKSYNLFVTGASSEPKLKHFKEDRLLSREMTTGQVERHRKAFDELMQALRGYRGRVNYDGWLEQESSQANATLSKVFDEDSFTVNNKTVGHTKTEHAPIKGNEELASRTDARIDGGQYRGLDKQIQEEPRRNRYFRSASLFDDTVVASWWSSNVLDGSKFTEPALLFNRFWKVLLENDPERQAILKTRKHGLLRVQIKRQVAN